jgi:hypothetical protein
MQRSFLLFGLIAILGVPAHAAARGFIVFSRSATQAYELGADKNLHLTATGPARDPEDHLACAGRVFGVEPLLHRVYRLGQDLKEDRSVNLGEVREIVRLVAADEARLYAFFDNTLAAFDAELKPAGRVTLDPGKTGEIVPVISPDDCQIFADKAYLLASNTGDVFAVDLKAWVAVRIPVPKDQAPREIRGQWIDPVERTLNVLVLRKTEEHTPDLDAAETRIIKHEVVLTFRLADLKQPPSETVLHEEREIHKPYPAGFLDDVARKNAQGIIIDYPPPYRSERPARGVYISKLSGTVPCFAEVFIKDGKAPAGLGSSDLVLLGTGGKIEKIERFRDEARNAIWFQHGGEVRILGREAGKWRLNLQPPAYVKLLEIPGMADATALAY